MLNTETLTEERPPALRAPPSPQAPAVALSPVFGHLKAPTMVDFPGRLAAVLFVSGCNFQCGFCHNARLMAGRRSGLPWAHLESRCRRWADHWVDGAVITGGEPTLTPELPALIAFLKRFGFAVKLDTNGSRPEVLAQCLPLVDYVAMDVKAGLSRYGELTGHADTGTIAASVELIRRHARDYEFRTTILDHIHTDDHMAEIGDLIRGARRYVVQPFLPRPDLPSPAYVNTPRTPAHRMSAIGKLMRDAAREVHVRGAP